MALAEEWLDFPAPEGVLKAFAVRPDGAPPWPALIILHPVTGVTEHVKDVTRSYAADGYFAFAPDLYTNDPAYPTHTRDDIDAAAHIGPNVATWDVHLAKFDEPRRSAVRAARQWMSDRPNGSYIHSVHGAFSFLAARPDIGLIGSIGYCMGGRLTAGLAALGVDLTAGVIYYGGSPADDEAKNVRAALQGHYAVTDRGITSKVYEFALALNAAGKSFEYSVYDAGHGFNDAMSPLSYNPAAARTARERASIFLAHHLKSPSLERSAGHA